jgi:hypothetical protein
LLSQREVSSVQGIIVGVKLTPKGPCPLVGESDVSRESDLSRAATRLFF